jgi:prophage antirepressor-like protein
MQTVTETIIHVVPFEDKQLKAIESIDHEFLMSSHDVAQGYGIKSANLREHKRQHDDELIEGKHFISVRKTDSNPRAGIPHIQTMWTKKGIVRLGFFIKSEEAKKFRDWAEDYILGGHAVATASDTHLMSLIETQTQTLSQMILASQRQSEMMMQAMNTISTLDMRVQEQSSLIHEMATELIRQDRTIERMHTQVSNSAIIAKDLNSYLRYQPLSREEKKRLGSKVTNRAKTLCENYGVSLEVATRSVWGLLNKRFNVTSYHDLTHENFLRAYDYVDLIELDGTTRDIDESRYEPYDRHASRAKNIFGDRDIPDEFSRYVDLGGIIIVDDE